MYVRDKESEGFFVEKLRQSENPCAILFVGYRIRLGPALALLLPLPTLHLACIPPCLHHPAAPCMSIPRWSEDWLEKVRHVPHQYRSA